MVNHDKIARTRGYRNNNPLNIIRNKTNWKGMCKAQTDDKFVQFETMFFGFRASIIIICRSYYLRGWWTIESIISHWAPSTENNTKAYIGFVVSKMGLSPNTKLPRPNLSSKRIWRNLIMAMTVYENGGWLEEYMADLDKALNQILK